MQVYFVKINVKRYFDIQYFSVDKVKINEVDIIVILLEIEFCVIRYEGFEYFW